MNAREFTEQHEEECKQREAEIHDNKKLFTQPDISYLEECPICCLPLSIDLKKSMLMHAAANIISATGVIMPTRKVRGKGG